MTDALPISRFPVPAGCSRLMGDDDAGTLARLAGVAHAMWNASDDLGHSCDASRVGVVIDVTAQPLSPPASRIIAEASDLVPRLAGVGNDVGNDYELVFTSPTDASPGIEFPSPELALPITATDARERKAGVRLVDAARKRVPITASGWQHF